MAVLLSAAFMELVDVSIVNIGIPLIQRDLRADSAAIQWIVAGYSVAFAVVLITGARLGDLYGRKRVFLFGMGLFTIASALCGGAPNTQVLIAARFVQGGAGGVMMPQILSIIQVVFSSRDRVKAIGAYGSVAGVATVIGPLVGALVIAMNIASLSWRPIFLINVVIGLPAMLAAGRLLPESTSPQAERLDAGGVALLSLGLVALFFPLIEGRIRGWPVWVFAFLGGGVLTLGLFLVYQSRRSHAQKAALVDLSLLRTASFSAGLVVSLVFFATIASFFLVATVWLQVGLGFTVIHAGLTGLPFSLGIVLGAVAAAQLTHRLGRPLLSVGALIMFAAIGAISWVAEHYGASVSSWELALPLLAGGAGMGLVVVPLIDFVLAPVGKDQVGHASGMASMMQPVGGAAGIALVGSVFFGSVATVGYAGAFQRALGVEVALLALTWGLIFLLPRHATPRESEPRA